MPYWTTMSLTELRAATKADIIKDVARYIADHFTKRQIIVWLLDVERIPDKVVITRDEQGRITRRVEVYRDPETGDVLGGRVTTKSYFDTGEIRYIVISDRDENNVETRRRRIWHFQDGRQPVMEQLVP